MVNSIVMATGGFYKVKAALMAVGAAGPCTVRMYYC